MNAKLEKGYADKQAGHTRSAKSVLLTSVKITIYDL